MILVTESVLVKMEYGRLELPSGKEVSLSQSCLLSTYLEAPVQFLPSEAWQNGETFDVFIEQET